MRDDSRLQVPVIAPRADTTAGGSRSSMTSFILHPTLLRRRRQIFPTSIRTEPDSLAPFPFPRGAKRRTALERRPEETMEKLTIVHGPRFGVVLGFGVRPVPCKYLRD